MLEFCILALCGSLAIRHLLRLRAAAKVRSRPTRTRALAKMG
jgi:hypothetical protein